MNVLGFLNVYQKNFIFFLLWHCYLLIRIYNLAYSESGLVRSLNAYSKNQAILGNF